MTCSKYITSIFLLTNLIFAKSDRNCMKTNIQLSQKIENEGFHRVANWLIEISQPSNETWMQNECRVLVVVNMNAGIFVNTDEIADLNRIESAKIRVEGNVNVETVAHESKEHIVYIYINSSMQKENFMMPFHLRYQKAQITGKFGKVVLKKPSILVHCNSSSVCSKYPKVDAPCSIKSNELCYWNNITYQALFDDAELFIPIGDLDDYPLVSIVSLLLGCTGCIYILSILSTAPV